jgi:hypothetical protein
MSVTKKKPYKGFEYKTGRRSRMIQLEATNPLDQT